MKRRKLARSALNIVLVTVVLLALAAPALAADGRVEPAAATSTASPASIAANAPPRDPGAAAKPTIPKDALPPVTTAADPWNNVYATADAAHPYYITLTATDLDLVDYIDWSWDAGPIQSFYVPINTTSYSYSVLVPVNTTAHTFDGRHTFWYRSRAWGGTVKDEPWNSKYVYIDSTPPNNSVVLTTPDGSGRADRWYHTGTVAFAFTATDPPATGHWYSGIWQIACYLDGSTAATANQFWGPGPIGPPSATLLWSGVTAGAANNGDHVIRYTSWDWGYPVEAQPNINNITHAKIDTIPPTLSQTGADANWHNHDVNVTFNADDPHSGVSMIAWSLDNGVTWPYQAFGADPQGPLTASATPLTIAAPASHANDGIHHILYGAFDWAWPVAGKIASQTAIDVKIDTVAPLTTQAGANSGVHSSPVLVTFSSSDPNTPNCSGVNYTEYRLDGGTWTTGGSVTIPAPADTTHTYAIDYRSMDFAGNLEATNSCQVEINTIAPDTDPPTTTASGFDANWHNTPVTVNFSAVDPGKGVDYTEYNLDGTGWVHGTSCVVPAPAGHTGDGLHTIQYRSVDKATPANAEATKNCQVKIDTTAPASSQSGADTGWHKTPVTVTFSGTDPGAPNSSGIGSTQYKLDGGAWTTGGTCTVPAPADHSGDGAHTITYRAVDNAGNTASDQTCTVNIDTTGPTTTALGSKSVRKGKKVTFKFMVVDTHGGVPLSPTATVKIVIKKGARTVKTLTVGSRTCGATSSFAWKCTLKPGKYTYSVMATDLAGNNAAVVGKAKLTVRL
jgi:hypothetical protein